MSAGDLPQRERRLLALREALANLGRPEAARADALMSDPVLRAAVERWLQVSVEACIHLVSQLIARRGWTWCAKGRGGRFDRGGAHQGSRLAQALI